MKIDWEILIVIIFLMVVGYILLGPPNEIGIPSGLVWYPTSDDNRAPTVDPLPLSPTRELYAKDAIKISDLTSRREIYSVGELAYISIKLENRKDLNYNLSVYWINKDKRVLGWGVSDNNKTYWDSWYPLDDT